MKFALVGTRVSEVHLRHLTNDQVTGGAFPKGDPEFSVGHGFSADISGFVVFFELAALVNQDPPILVTLTYEAAFKTDAPLTDDEKQSHFVRKNAPAIAYPYLRSYVSQLTMLSGYDTLILKTVNFANLDEEGKTPADSTAVPEQSALNPSGNQ